MNRDSSINNIRRFERLSEVLAQLSISVQDASGNFRKVLEVINDLLAVNRALSFKRSIFKYEFLVAEAYDLIISELEVPEPKAANTQIDEINMAVYKDYKPSKELNDFLSAFKVIEKGVESK